MLTELVNSECFADGVDWSELVQNLSQACGVQIVDFEVPVFRLRAHEGVANTATDKQSTAARVVYGAGKGRDINHG